MPLPCSSGVASIPAPQMQVATPLSMGSQSDIWSIHSMLWKDIVGSSRWNQGQNSWQRQDPMICCQVSKSAGGLRVDFFYQALAFQMGTTCKSLRTRDGDPIGSPWTLAWLSVQTRLHSLRPATRPERRPERHLSFRETQGAGYSRVTHGGLRPRSRIKRGKWQSVQF
jgi:hypothetical protein